MTRVRAWLRVTHSVWVHDSGLVLALDGGGAWQLYAKGNRIGPQWWSRFAAMGAVEGRR